MISQKTITNLNFATDELEKAEKILGSIGGVKNTMICTEYEGEDFILIDITTEELKEILAKVIRRNKTYIGELNQLAAREAQEA